MHLLPEITDSAEAIQEIRRNIHAHPELRFEEPLKEIPQDLDFLNKG